MQRTTPSPSPSVGLNLDGSMQSSRGSNSGSKLDEAIGSPPDTSNPRQGRLSVRAPSSAPTNPEGSNRSMMLMSPSSPSLKAIAGGDVKRSDTDEDLLRGQVQWEIDRDEIDWGGQKPLGTGTYGVVVCAKWRGTPVAIKKVNIESEAKKAVAVADLRHEIAVMSHMHHPRVVQFLGACTRVTPWLIMFEYLPGGTLQHAVDEGNFPAHVAYKWSLECAQGLRYLHEHKPRPVIHRDLKPSNLLIDASGAAKIGDFGLARMIDIVKTLNESYVMTGETGSYRYMAPEVFRHEPYTEKVDIYSLGCMIYFIFMGVPPLYDLPPVQAAQAAALLHRRAVFRPNIDKRIKDLVDECWRPIPAERPTAAKVCQVLEAIRVDYPASSAGCGCSVA